ncbi:MAG: OsmC family protein [Chrysiogenetes bacterium]|nr:OsmC family protein [Chrysiogenetes bacterium]
MEQHEVTLTSKIEGFRQTIQAGPHTLIADEPESLGGTGQGPNPYELLCSALAACTSITIEMYATRKGWPLEGVEVRVHHAKVHAEDCADCEGKDGLIDRMERHIVLKGPLDEEQRERLAVIASKCPVHKTIRAGATVVDEVVLG